MSSKTPNKNQRQKQAMIRIMIMAGILICVNVLASYFHRGFDLTRENRFTLSPSTKKFLHNMQETAVIDVYLKGKNFPAELQRLQEAVRERLTSFKDIAGNKIIFRFTDPLEGKTDQEKKQIARDMAQQGMEMKGTKNSNADEEGYTTKFFFPYALVQYNGKNLPILLTEKLLGQTPAEQINYAESKLENKFVEALNELQKPSRARIAYVIGNEEDLGINTVDMLASLPGYYFLDTIDLAHIQQVSLAYDAIIINQPKITFTGPEKLKLDQYIMKGGRVLWNINQLNASIDSLQAHPPQIMAMEYGLDLDNLLFKYGVRVNNDLVEDRQNLPLPYVVNNGQPELHEWVYFPKLNPTSDHPIVRNMDFIFGQFTNSIDTLITSGIKKTILLQSSKYSRTSTAPVRVSLTMMSFPLNNEMFNRPYRPVAVLLEGKFTSAYKNKLAPEFLHFLADTLKMPFKPECDSDNRMIVTAVGNLFNNDYSPKSGIITMGFYRYDRQYYANKNFLLNCLEYLTDRSDILDSRSKEVKLRLLDNGRAKDEKTQWQLVNVAIPIAAVLIFASCYLFFRKRRYEIKETTKNPS